MIYGHSWKKKRKLQECYPEKYSSEWITNSLNWNQLNRVCSEVFFHKGDCFECSIKTYSTSYCWSFILNYSTYFAQSCVTSSSKLTNKFIFIAYSSKDFKFLKQNVLCVSCKNMWFSTGSPRLCFHIQGHTNYEWCCQEHISFDRHGFL